MADIPDHQNHLVGYPEVQRRHSVFHVDGQFREEVVEQINPDARKNESRVIWRVAGWRLFHERPELARFLR